MYTIDEINEMLNDIADEIPGAFFKDLNGGIILSPDTKLHTADKTENLYTLGEYNFSGAMGRSIVLYYGSLMKTCGGASYRYVREQLKKVLLHEFTHHVESLAGERGLEYKDAQRIGDYLRRIQGKE